MLRLQQSIIQKQQHPNKLNVDVVYWIKRELGSLNALKVHYYGYGESLIIILIIIDD